MATKKAGGSSRNGRDSAGRRLGRGSTGERSARHHQRAAHGRYGRGGPPVQRQRVDCRRSASIRRIHEIRRRPIGDSHGPGRQCCPGQDCPGDGQGGCPRHRQEPGGHHPVQQRIPSD